MHVFRELGLTLEYGTGSIMGTSGVKAMKPLTIGHVARRSGVGIETVRFYEREGLLNRPARSPSSGYRLYE